MPVSGRVSIEQGESPVVQLDLHKQEFAVEERQSFRTSVSTRILKVKFATSRLTRYERTRAPVDPPRRAEKPDSFSVNQTSGAAAFRRPHELILGLN